MVYPIPKSLQYLSLLYLFVVLLEAISWPLGSVFFFENLLFVPILFVACYIILKNKGVFQTVSFVALGAFISFLLIELVSTHEFISSHWLYLMRWIKYAVIFVLSHYFYRLFNGHQIDVFIKLICRYD